MRHKLKERAIKFYARHPCCHKMRHYKNYLCIINGRKGSFFNTGGRRGALNNKIFTPWRFGWEINMPSQHLPFPLVMHGARRPWRISRGQSWSSLYLNRWPASKWSASRLLRFPQLRGDYSIAKSSAVCKLTRACGRDWPFY